MDWWSKLSQALQSEELLWAVHVFVVSLVGSLAVVVLMIVLLPSRYFLDRRERKFWADRHPVIRWLGLIGKNILGVALVVVGAGLSLPGIPGQGLLTIFVGLMLLNFPGKRRLLRRLVRHPRIFRTLNRIRSWFHRPPFVLDRSRGVPAPPQGANE